VLKVRVVNWCVLVDVLERIERQANLVGGACKGVGS